MTRKSNIYNKNGSVRKPGCGKCCTDLYAPMHIVDFFARLLIVRCDDY